VFGEGEFWLGDATALAEAEGWICGGRGAGAEEAANFLECH